MLRAGTAALEGMREEVKSQNIAATSARAALYAEESQTRQWQDSCATLEAEVVTLRYVFGMIVVCGRVTLAT